MDRKEAYEITINVIDYDLLVYEIMLPVENFQRFHVSFFSDPLFLSSNSEYLLKILLRKINSLFLQTSLYFPYICAFTSNLIRLYRAFLPNFVLLAPDARDLFIGGRGRGQRGERGGLSPK